MIWMLPKIIGQDLIFDKNQHSELPLDFEANIQKTEL